MGFLNKYVDLWIYNVTEALYYRDQGKVSLINCYIVDANHHRRSGTDSSFRLICFRIMIVLYFKTFNIRIKETATCKFHNSFTPLSLAFNALI